MVSENRTTGFSSHEEADSIESSMAYGNPLKKGDPALQISGLCKSYREGTKVRKVLDHVDFTISQGELVVFLGRSGSGKSTLLNLVSGLDYPDQGEVFVGGTCLTGMNERDRTLFRRDNIGFIFQSFNLIPTLTVAENVFMPLELMGASGKEDHDRAHKHLSDVGLADRADSFPDRLSGGEQQRVTIARALAHDPLLILADEPTGNLDEQTGHHVMTTLHEMIRKTGRTMLIATHDQSLCAMADRVVQLRDGKLEEVTGLAGKAEKGSAT